MNNFVATLGIEFAVRDMGSCYLMLYKGTNRKNKKAPKLPQKERQEQHLTN